MGRLVHDEVGFELYLSREIAGRIVIFVLREETERIPQWQS